MAEGRLSSAEVADHALFALEVAARSCVPDLALSAIRRALQGLAADDVARVAACLALQAVRGRPPAAVAAQLEVLALEHQMMLDFPAGSGGSGAPR
ncbi:hypothetical protein [Streptosporangium pseudovulgare]|uniref:ANTAR domain-containing protein n=1 Tax=Streptosporangium pseudovulgare TaxID=35765 RepID=A0ABQ2REZ6_9ACTN|nr:hypothetical protein [Streptosporangium pseudovulgare]GGQ23659.1 hypothetical protein GCM10010140_62420 [Streptosporangium pseudovulgare]